MRIEDDRGILLKCKSLFRNIDHGVLPEGELLKPTSRMKNRLYVKKIEEKMEINTTISLKY